MRTAETVGRLVPTSGSGVVRPHAEGEWEPNTCAEIGLPQHKRQDRNSALTLLLMQMPPLRLLVKQVERRGLGAKRRLRGRGKLLVPLVPGLSLEDARATDDMQRRHVWRQLLNYGTAAEEAPNAGLTDRQTTNITSTLQYMYEEERMLMHQSFMLLLGQITVEVVDLLCNAPVMISDDASRHEEDPEEELQVEDDAEDDEEADQPSLLQRTRPVGGCVSFRPPWIDLDDPTRLEGSWKAWSTVLGV